MPDSQNRTALNDQAVGTTAQAIVDIVIVAYNSRDTLRACVEPLVQIPWVERHRCRQRVARRLRCGGR